MVRAELTYNPYLLETEVRFNGIPPRINSLVEKYKGQYLENWIRKIPHIFHDEMNGYDFELDFTGTNLDFDELKSSFEAAGIGPDQVQLFHKGELDGRMEKVSAINGLLKWLNENPDRKFDIEAFRENNRELFEEIYSYVVIGSMVDDEQLFADLKIAVDNVASIDELEKTDLRSTPVLLCVDRESAGTLQYNLSGLLKRPDISQEQLFFLIDPALREKAERVIQDLGVSSPQLVSVLNDKAVRRYIELYPVTEFIYQSIRVFRKQTDDIGSVLKDENNRSQIKNKSIYDEISKLEDMISHFKASKSLFDERDNLEMPSAFNTANEVLINSISNWNIRKTKMSSPDEAKRQAVNFDSDISRFYNDFRQAIKRIYDRACIDLLAKCGSWYQEAHYADSFHVYGIDPPELVEYSVPHMENGFLKIKEQQYVAPKENLFGQIFRQSDIHSSDPVIRTDYYYEHWRSFAVNTVKPISEKMISAAFESINKYFEQIASQYSEHIDMLIKHTSSKKETITAGLSKDERKLQADNDWFMSFCDMLQQIERS